MGLYLSFKYDYNLQRADMFNDHVGAVSVYVFDESGNYVTCREVENEGGYRPLSDPAYAMRMDLPPGRYQFLVLAGQCGYDEMLASGRARFMRTLPEVGEHMSRTGVRLESRENPGVASGYLVDNHGLPLDTLWHGMECTLVEVFAERPTYHRISLVRDTKKINVTLRELDDPTEMDVADYDMKIVDRNSLLRWDNSVDESYGTVTYLPHSTWNTLDRTPVAGRSDAEGEPEKGKIAHADFMTSRIIYHDNPADDAVLSITDRRSGKEVVRVNLPDMLTRLSNGDDYYRYTPQEFLDRGYDYQMDFFLIGGKLAFVDISISVLSWGVRVQFVDDL